MQNILGATLMMSCLGYPQMRLYWAGGTKVPAIADVLTRDRFFTLRSNFKVVNDLDFIEEDQKNDRLWKVRPTLNEVQAACRKLPRTPSVCVDEQIILFTGVTTLKRYKPGKPHPTGLKNFVLTSPSGLLLDFGIYQGKTFLKIGSSPDLGLRPNVGRVFAKTLPIRTSLFFDRYFTTPPLTEQLGKLNLQRTVKWLDNKAITFASNHVDEEPFGQCRRWSKKENVYQDIPRRAVVEEYNRNMGRVAVPSGEPDLFGKTTMHS
ncbi:hypothetical protein HPB50_013741 [Hyalomma asiaticum]|uniref:Uncharacterized protein n=1 Tax=Hyalomma asiaticum TaxID=266040 RepID=A0ACB7SJA9_HYAAI|nr:hypothetical protein HPB50_013741 [Hyalomma asiaticum]